MENNTQPTEVQLVGTTEILGKEIKFYGTWEYPYFLGKDVAKWIDYAKRSDGSYQVGQMLNTIDEDEKLTLKVLTGGQTRRMWFLTEDGLYEVLMQSTKTIAKQLKKKIKTHLKQMRQTGGTVIVGQEEYFIAHMFPSLSDELKAQMVKELQEANRKQQEEIERQRKENTKLKGQLDTLVNELTTFDQFNRVMNACVNAISKNTKVKNHEVWGTFYNYMKKAHGMCLKTRATNQRNKLDSQYFERTGKHYSESTLKQKVSVLSTVRPDEYITVLQVMKAFALDNNVDIEKIVKLELQPNPNVA